MVFNCSDNVRVYPEITLFTGGKSDLHHYLVGICPTPEAAVAGTAGTAVTEAKGALAPGICAAPVAAEAAVEGAVTEDFSKTLLPVERGWALPK